MRCVSYRRRMPCDRDVIVLSLLRHERAALVPVRACAHVWCAQGCVCVRVCLCVCSGTRACACARVLACLCVRVRLGLCGTRMRDSQISVRPRKPPLHRINLDAVAANVQEATLLLATRSDAIQDRKPYATAADHPRRRSLAGAPFPRAGA